MKIHEYQAKEILAKYGVAVPKGEMANTLEEAIEVTRIYPGGFWEDQGYDWFSGS